MAKSNYQRRVEAIKNMRVKSLLLEQQTDAELLLGEAVRQAWQADWKDFDLAKLKKLADEHCKPLWGK